MKGAIFDLGGVVIPWSNATTYGFIEEKYGVPEADFRRVAQEEMPVVQLGKMSETDWMAHTFERLGLDHPEGYEEVWGTTFEAARYDADIVDLIKRLRSRGYRVAALSNVEASRARWLRTHGLESLFDEVILSCEVGMRKPDLTPGTSGDIEIFKFTTKRLGVETNECPFVDDNINCVEAGKIAGLDSILYRGYKELLAEFDARGMLL